MIPAAPRRHRPNRPLLIAGFATSALVLAACGGGGAGDSDADYTVVTSTDVYADIVRQIAGDDVDVRAIIEDPATDPHSYEATPQDQLTLSRADLVVANGGGYDEFVDTLLEGGDNDPEVISAVDVSGLEGAEDAGHDHDHGDHDHAEDDHDHDHAEDDHDHDHAEDDHDHDHAEDDHGHHHDHGGFNEHVWYSLSAMQNLGDAIGESLAEALPADAEGIEQRAAGFHSSLDDLIQRTGALTAEHEGQEIGVTEPVSLYLYQDMGLKNVVSDEFISAVESGNDVPPLVLEDAVEQVSEGDLGFLAVNTQSAGPEAEQLRDAAEQAGTPVLEVVETMPEGQDYLSWMDASITDAETALARQE